MSFDSPYISNLNQNCTQIITTSKQITLSQVYNNDLRNLVKRIISEDPHKRPTSIEASSDMNALMSYKAYKKSEQNIKQLIYNYDDKFIACI